MYPQKSAYQNMCVSSGLFISLQFHTCKLKIIVIDFIFNSCHCSISIIVSINFNIKLKSMDTNKGLINESNEVKNSDPADNPDKKTE